MSLPPPSSTAQVAFISGGQPRAPSNWGGVSTHTAKAAPATAVSCRSKLSASLPSLSAPAPPPQSPSSPPTAFTRYSLLKSFVQLNVASNFSWDSIFSDDNLNQSAFFVIFFNLGNLNRPEIFEMEENEAMIITVFKKSRYLWIKI